MTSSVPAFPRAEPSDAPGSSSAIREIQGRNPRSAGTHLLETLIQDLRYALRIVAQSLRLPGVVILTLASASAPTPAIFTMMNGLMLHTLPVRDPEQLVESSTIIRRTEPGFNGFSWTPTRSCGTAITFSRT